MYLSSILDKSIKNKTGEYVGKIQDAVLIHINRPLPMVNGFVVRRSSKERAFFIPIEDVASFEGKALCLNTDTINFTPFALRDDETLLAQHILDKQIIDVKERDLTRINDLELSLSGNHLFLTAVDVSVRALLNRLGLPTWGFLFKYNRIVWQNIQFMGVNLPVKANIDYDRLETLHPADIARFILRGPGYQKGSQIIQSLEEDIAADVVESLPLDLQATVMENMSVETAARIISEMESHHAADLLAELDESFVNNILKQIKTEHSTIVKQLLTYPEHSAGSLMKVEFIAVPHTMTVEELLTHLRNLPKLPEFLLYFYITESVASKKLVGIASLWEVLHASGRQRLESIMIRDFQTVSPTDRAQRVLKKLLRYNISAIPVVDKEHKILGIVTLSHAVDIIVPKNWERQALWNE